MNATKSLSLLWTFVMVFVGITGNIRSNVSISGWTYPKGDIVIEYGQPLNITCVLFDDIQEIDTSENLFFVKNSINIFPKESVEVINATSVALYIKHPNLSSGDNYTCYYRIPSDIVGTNIVSVGLQPQNATDFFCASRNFQDLKCTWTCPENYLKTEYRLWYNLIKNNGIPRKNNFHCPEYKREKENMSCTWTISSYPNYRVAQQYFLFSLTANNTLGKTVLISKIEHYKYMIPNAPESLKAFAISADSIQLKWNVSSKLMSFPPGLHHRILYQCKYFDKNWQFGALITDQLKNMVPVFNLTGLKYAHAPYNIRVSSRSAIADPDANWAWSENATQTALTLNKAPDVPPEINVGSFEIINVITRTVYIFWKQIREESTIGRNISYKVEVEELGVVSYSTGSFVKFINLKASDYQVNVWSENDQGISLNKSTLMIPARRFPEVHNFIKLVTIDHNIELKWDPPKTDKIISNFTIFWCRSEKDRPYECDGKLDWVTVANDTVSYTFTKKELYQFAISTNGLTSSSGMLWAECTIIANYDVGLLHNIWTTTAGTDYIDVEWVLDCMDRIPSVQGFIIHYCQVEKEQTGCIDDMKNLTIPDKYARDARIQDLKPFHTYQIRATVIITDTIFSLPSKSLYKNTNQAAPDTSPMNIRPLNISESVINIAWDAPLEINGNLTNYIIYLNNTRYKVEPNKNNFTFSNLTSYGKYSITIEACTIACSKPSQPLTITTGMGRPGKINKPVILGLSKSLLIIEWEKPNPPRGKINYYQLRLSYHNHVNLYNRTDIFLNVSNSQNYTLSCNTQPSNFSIFVRAVNIVEDRHLTGHWSEGYLVTNCYSAPSYIYVAVTVSFFFIILALYIVFKKSYFYITDLKNVNPKLPPGLQDVVDKELWFAKFAEESANSLRPRQEEELLLNKIPQESFDISDNENKKITYTESETELTTTIGTFLRQRNKSFNSIDLKLPNTGYSVIGVDCNGPTTEDEPTSSYVIAGDTIKTPNSGYVPFTNLANVEKNNCYVQTSLPQELKITADTLSTKILCEHPLNSSFVQSGYVTVGDALSLKNRIDLSQRHCDATKSIKED